MMQYADFLRLAFDKVTYRDLLPPLADLLDPEKYGLEPEVAFLLYRPVLSRVPFPAPPSAKDEEDGEIPEGDQVPMEVEQGETTTGAALPSQTACHAANPVLRNRRHISDALLYIMYKARLQTQQHLVIIRNKPYSIISQVKVWYCW